ncbi:MAG: DHH family phosphoesterase [Chloroflexota bacterium]|nr:MAG: DHH family phosphoesterase [Chloroflexota bacterium]UCF28740.1 MAG: DHH family phosphoesterase [Chloroflexota bacterium]
MTRTYVIGHVNPDTDSIASAMGYAWFLHELEGEDIQAARAGPVNPQTMWVLKKLGLESPVLLNDASPRFESVSVRLDTTSPDDPLREAWAIASRTWGVAPIVRDDGTPYGLVNGPSLFALLSKLVGPHPRRQEMKISEILDLPCREAADTNVPRFQESGRIRDSILRIMRAEGDDFWVVNEQGKYVGVCRQREALNPPRLRLILVDHNEPNQAIGALEDAELVEILDHHRLGSTTTHVPIRFTIDVVGSTSTLVTERIEESGLSAPPNLAGLLLAGLLADTLLLHSPTTTDRDRQAAERLARWSFIPGAPLDGESMESYGEQVIRAGSGIASREPSEVVNTDTKVYSAGGEDFAIAQAEVTDFVLLKERLPNLQQALCDLRDKRGLDFAMLMVTDVVEGSSRLVFTEDLPILGELPYPKQSDGTLYAEGVVSRKKQLLPVVLGLLEG